MQNVRSSSVGEVDEEVTWQCLKRSRWCTVDWRAWLLHPVYLHTKAKQNICPQLSK